MSMRGDETLPPPDFEAAPLPANEAARTQRVHRSGVMDVRQEDRYQIYVDMARLITACPVAYTGLLDEDRQFFLAKDFDGQFDVTELARPLTLCQYALGSTQPMIVPDLREHPKLKTNRLVTAPPNWVFWGAYPLVTQDGLVLGTLCTADYTPRIMEPRQVQGMQSLANNLVLLLTLQMQERDAITERMAKLAAYFHRTHPDLRPAELEAFLSLCSGQPLDKQWLDRLAQWDIVTLAGKTPELTALGRTIQAEHGLHAATFRRQTAEQKTSIDIENLFAMID
ncbi:GAF domain-containing protein [Roseovarius aquimarinus]|uniref:GAF domain-containing protein n=1 Tax=Roseovarius aquimarinus TaxID=1229156 RepID=A0ABW7I8G6_9RHOB